MARDAARDGLRKPQDFELCRFLPYLLNQAAETTGKAFQPVYKDAYGMTRPQWRVIANLGRFGTMTAQRISRVAYVEKTQVSRAVAALEQRGWLVRARSPDDGRFEMLSLTAAGRAVFRRLGEDAIAFDQQLRAALGPQASSRLEEALMHLIGREASGNGGTTKHE